MYLIHRFNKNYSTLYLDLMSEFGKERGFHTILEKVADKNMKINVELLFAYIELLAAPHNLYHRRFVSETIAPFVESVFKYMGNIPDEELRNIKRERLEFALNQMELLMRRVYTAKTKGEQEIRLRVFIALSLLRSDLLERRIQAIRILSETCKSAKASQMATFQASLPSLNDAAILSGILQVPQVIGEIFGKKSHIQLIQRSIEILRFFFAK